ncbi:MAG: hypothetical protein IPP29_19235 [Bacteroidetes bacterium]|nr:hypothetical protein [Bacteroidota bacterium]
MLLYLCLLGSTVYSQNKNNIWIFGDSCGIDFSNINNPVPITSNMDGRGSCASIADSNGYLICYASVLGYLNSDWATRIFNAQHQILQGANHITVRLVQRSSNNSQTKRCQ